MSDLKEQATASLKQQPANKKKAESKEFTGELPELQNGLFGKLAKAQAYFKPAVKDNDNPFFKSKYADLASIWGACHNAIAENGLFVSQQSKYHPEAGIWVIETKVYDDSGEFISGTTPVIAAKQNDPQAFGSAMTYSRRYGLAAILGIVTDDDDAEAAMSRTRTANSSEPEKLITKEQKAKIKELVAHNMITPSEEAGALALAVDSTTFIMAGQAIAKLQRLIQERTKEEQPPF